MRNVTNSNYSFLVLWLCLSELENRNCIYYHRYGTQIDPINMDEKMGPMDIPFQQGFVKSNARVQGIEIHGMSSAALEKVS